MILSVILTLVLTLVLSSAPAETKKTADKLEPRFDTRLSALPSRGVVRSSETTVTPQAPIPAPPAPIVKPAVPHVHPPVVKAIAPIVQLPAPRPAPVPTNQIEALILKYANQYGVDYARVLRIAKCESGLNPIARNGQYCGIYQQMESAWPARAASQGRPGASIWDADANIQVSIAMMSQGGWSHWECK